MKILNADQIKQWDAYTIKEEPIASIDLMERASYTFVQWFIKQFPEEDQPILIFVGPGNNGGDGLAIARLLHFRFYNVKIYRCEISEQTSPDFALNWERLPKRRDVPVTKIKAGDPIPAMEKSAVIIDAIFGSGLNRPVEGYWADLLNALNEKENTIISVDIPSGLFADQHTKGACIHAQHTFAFERPKLSFFFPENQDRCGEWLVRSIGLSPAFSEAPTTSFYQIDVRQIRSILQERPKFSHKGTFGHALLVMGRYGQAGAAILAARACLRSGTGLVSIHAPRVTYPILQTAIPEAIISIDMHDYFFKEAPDLEKYQAIGVGCGLGTRQESCLAFRELLSKADRPMVLDADALNILSTRPEWHSLIPKHSILTPHPKEFERLFGPSVNDFERNERQRERAQALSVYIVLKGANSCIATPEGICYFNTTGNPGMATAGSGDVLSGILTGLLAQGYASLDSCLLGTYLHGLAGDIALSEYHSPEALIASDLVDHLGRAFSRIREDV